MSFDNVVDTLTLEEIVPRVVDTVLRGNVFATKMLSKTKRFGAATMDFPRLYGELKFFLIREKLRLLIPSKQVDNQYQFVI